MYITFLQDIVSIEESSTSLSTNASPFVNGKPSAAVKPLIPPLAGGVSVREEGVVSVTVISLSSCGLTEQMETSGGLK